MRIRREVSEAVSHGRDAADAVADEVARTGATVRAAVNQMAGYLQGVGDDVREQNRQMNAAIILAAATIAVLAATGVLLNLRRLGAWR